MEAIRERKTCTCAFLTLGCKVNQADTEALRRDLIRAGWQECSPDNGADLYVINTCAVTRVAEAKSRRLIRRIGRLAPHSRIIVAGCYAYTRPEEIAQLPGVELILPPAQESRLTELLGRPDFITPSQPKPFRTRAILKIQDGCAAYCSFCILPFTRGRPTSKSLEQVTEEAEDLVQSGYKEIVLTGINLGQYGKDLNPPVSPVRSFPRTRDYQDASNGVSLMDVLERLIRIQGLKRIRLSSIELDGLDSRLLHFMQANPEVCPHLHIPLQSGSDKILERMNRHYTAREYLDCLSQVRERLDNPAITTDVMAGFPGETDEDFQSTLTVCQKAGFSKIHIFPYSVRPGTKAAKLSQIPTLRVRTTLIRQRVKVLGELASSLALHYKEGFVGQTVEVLLEGEGKSGFTERYLKVQVNDGKHNLVNQLVKVKVAKATPERLVGRAYPFVQ